MRARAGTWIVVIFGLISLIKALPLTDRDYRKHFYQESSEQEQEQEQGSTEEQFGEDVDEPGVRPKRVVKGDRKENGFDADWLKRFYVETEECDCDDDPTEVTTTTKGLKKRRKWKCRKTTTTSTTTECTTSTTTTELSTTTTTLSPTSTTTTTTASTTTTTTTEPPNTTSSTTTAAPFTPCLNLPHHPIFSLKQPKRLPPRFPPVCATTTAPGATTATTTTNRPQQHRAKTIPDFLDDRNDENNRDILSRILRKLNRLYPREPFSRSAQRLKKSPVHDSESISASQEGQLDDNEEEMDLKVPRKRVVGVRPAIISYDRARDARGQSSTDDGARCRRSKEDHEYVRYLRNMLREAKRQMRLRRNELVPC